MPAANKVDINIVQDVKRTKRMEPQAFCYWLQGFAELNDKPPTAEQWKAIRDHLALTFNKVTPQYFSGGPLNPGLLRDNPLGPLQVTC